MNIGISLYWGGTYKHLFSNGAGQNMFFLLNCLARVPGVDKVYFVYWDIALEDMGDNIRNSIPEGVELHHYSEVLDELDVIIEGTLGLDLNRAQEFRNHNVKIVSYRMGNDFIMDMEALVNKNENGGRAFTGVRYDAVWIIPHLMKTNAPYVNIVTGAPVYEVPHLWEPVFLEGILQEAGVDSAKYPYQPNGERHKRVAVFEPNMSVLKNMMTPVLICEDLYKRRPDMLDHAYMCNAVHLKDMKTLKQYLGYMKCVADNVLTIEARFVMPLFMIEYVDIVLSHQWECGLNYVYYEALYGNYPLVHNSDFLRDHHVGFYYHEFDAYEGSQALANAIASYDENFDYHKKINQDYLYTLSPYNPMNIERHKVLLDLLMN